MMPRWLTDWRLVATWTSVLLGAALIGLLAAGFVEAAQARSDAVEAAREAARQQSEQRAASLVRLADLTDSVDALAEDVADGRATVARLEAQVEALRAQIRASGDEPLVGEDRPPAREPDPEPSPQPGPPEPGPEPSPEPEPEPEPSPEPSPEPTPTCSIVSPLACIPN